VSRLLPLFFSFGIVACGGKGCVGCGVVAPPSPLPEVPQELTLAPAFEGRLTQHGFDVVSNHLIEILKATFGTNAQGQAVIDFQKLTGAPPPKFQGKFGPISGDASVRDLVVTLDLDALTVVLVDPSDPARVRVSIDHARIGVDSAIVAGAADFAGIGSDVACHLHNGLAKGTPDAHLATVSAEIDAVLGVDAKGQLDVSVQVSKPVLHEIGFVTVKDCALPECSDKLGIEDACIECTLCDTGKFGSDAIAALEKLLGPLFGQLLEVVANELVKSVLQGGLNGAPLDVTLPVDVRSLVVKASPELGALLPSAGPLLVHVRPAPSAFVVSDGGLDVSMHGALFAKADPCVDEPGADDTPMFATAPQGPPPDLDALVEVEPGLKVPPDAAIALSRAFIDEGLWALVRSGQLCVAVDSESLWTLSKGKLALTAEVADLALPGLRALAGVDAPLRVSLSPAARPGEAPFVTLGAPTSGGVRLDALVRHARVAVSAMVDGRWLGVLELEVDVKITMTVRAEAHNLALSIDKVSLPALKVTHDELFGHAEIEKILPTVAEAGVAVLFAKPLAFAVDLDAAIASVFKLPIEAGLLGVEAGGDDLDWLRLTLRLSDKPAPPPGGAP